MKNFLLDTSVILDSLENVIHLYQNGENNIYVSDIVIKELDGHKEDMINEKGFSARSFARILDEASEIQHTFEPILSKDKLNNGDNLIVFPCKFKGSKELIYIQVLTRIKYDNDATSNDLKIIEMAKTYDLELITNDTYLNLQAKTANVVSSSMKKDKVKSPGDILFHENIILNEEHSDEEIYIELHKNYSHLKAWTQIYISYKKSTKQDFFIVTNSKVGTDFRYKKINQKEVRKLYKVIPINREQEFYAEMISNPSFQLGVATGFTGSGKTLIAFLEGLRRVQSKDSSINGIVYIRNTVTANDHVAELGFRKGDQDQKLGYFAYPLYGAINFYINATKKKNEKKESDKTIKEEKTEEFMEKNNIEVMDIAHARGITITDKWVIFDELQNASNDTLKLMGTRIGKGSKMIMLGDYKQVDHPYLTENRNALVYMLKIAKENKTGDIPTIQLRTTIRSEIANWFDKNL
ncbi:MAG TPA: phosphate starvation-inducible protein PhoH [Bacteroidia bacterium]|nr:phosphate starvation-inducible protein PhoH [Bacteroidia bacterium]